MVKPNNVPLITHTPEQILAWRHGSPIRAKTFLSDVQSLAAALPEHRYLFNLCEDRYRFMVGFAAAMQRDIITLMPPNNTAGAINELLQHYPKSACLTDTAQHDIQAPCFDFEQLRQQQTASAEARPCTIALDQEVAILFTSGTTGRSKANPKRWYNLYQEAISALNHFPFQRSGIRSLVATVPSQHMYGLATAILFPWRGKFAVDTGRPFFPADIANTLSQLPEPRVLITTPLHLRACVCADLDWPAVEFVISATAPLSRELAAAAEAQLKTEIHEIYGSTETGSIAGRHTAREDHWRLYHGISLHADQSGHHAQGGHVTEPAPLNDRLQIESTETFRLLGRDSDMVKIAGKRGSLGHLAHQLLSIPGVEDGIFLPPVEESSQARLMALVVAPTLTKQQVLDALAYSIDAVFLPRPLFCVERLPRNATGKISQAALQALLQNLQS
jgi:acyl-coenzyme A synthetase/AMP-(fatty) acid ligase